MTKVAQCSKCRIGKGVHCEYYRPTDDSDYSHFVLGIDRAADNNKAFVWKYIWYVAIVACWVVGACMEDWCFAYIGGFILFLVLFLLYFIIVRARKLFKCYPYMKIRKLVIDTLRNIGCQPEVDKKTEDVRFKYQGEGFVMKIESNATLTIYNPWWSVLDLNDPKIENLKDAVNQANMITMPVTVYSIDKDESLLGVHSQYSMFFTKEMSDKEFLFTTVLDSFFSAHQEVRRRFIALSDVQREDKKKDRVRIKGFACSEDVNMKNE